MKKPSIDQYEQRLIAFIDVLGWRQFIQGMETEPSHFDRVLSAVKTFEEHAKNFRYLPDSESDEIDGTIYDAEISLFSDSIVVSCFDTPEHYLPFLSGIATMCFELLGAADLLCRGGITSGRLFHDGHRVFGSGLIEAYDLESIIAKYPRIVMDSAVVNRFLCDEVSISRCPLGIPSKDIYLRTDPDDEIVYLDYLRVLLEFRCQGEPGLSREEQMTGMRAVRKRLIAMRNAAPRIDRVLMKHDWFGAYFNTIASEHGLPREFLLPYENSAQPDALLDANKPRRSG